MKKKGGRLILIEVGVVVAIALILILIMPVVLSAFRLNLLGRFLSLAIVALGLDLIWGYTGLLSLGHGILFSLGGYAIAMYLKLQVPSGELPDFMGLYGVTELPWFWQPFYSFPVATVAVVLIPGLLAGLLGYLVFRNRLKGVYFSILTQAAVIIFFNFFNGQQKLFNGTNGLTGFQTLFEANVSDSQTQFIFYTLTVIFLAATYGICRWLTSGRFGRLLIAIRDDESRVRFSGYNPTEFKVLVFAVSGAIAGIAGAFYTLQSGSVSPRSMDIAFSIEMVIWVAVGGRATLTGAIVGTLLVNYARTFLSEQFAEIWLFFQGALFLIVVTVLPDGIMGWLKNQKIILFNRPQQIATYPTLEEDPEVQNERQNLGN
ncbi:MULTISPECIES: urea ABC transporter permease subunit UrtC [Cyanophyceae]|uniref:Urea ABC transporter permease subunit UrtC n=1 Tax=Nodularia spumigena CENA596 TaxID=1819295 RepID=A0A161XRN8_NODSP|nr:MULTISPECIES: urea ABC transporter permease subunit UrtC [Cyanophyceae]MDB9357201.1 urea ABC transporter permease subunit UrtC [Nodularia spumigena CS-587/03]KZL51794.1 urea ABC transporter permease subunit UrtC [Nodularia spumigena CENA596]MDB9305854.1 urea ABC transporter permease subunit UrtC [Nodularia spumigena CS-591/12]MDB9323491.1 urea ABC transporter permease subunit UrtC [Nodularia spumigena CS-591/07A]MDB9329497.1 urea ABC transporter permease subunit UrtC [Nodularia spumigena CS